MQQTYQINTENLNSKFLEAVKALFGKKEVRIVIEDLKLNLDELPTNVSNISN